MNSKPMNSLEGDSRLRALLENLHASSTSQEVTTTAYLASAGSRSTIGSEVELNEGRPFWSDKLVALDKDKAQFCYLLCRSLRARYIVEAGTSHGVSTLYLAAALRDNGGGTVVGTEWEAQKAEIARANFAQANLDSYIDLREGDIRQTLRTVAAPVDFLLLDIWTPLARPVIELIAPHMRAGAIVVADNTRNRRAEYAEFLDYLHDPRHGFATTTLPFSGGLEMSVKLGTGTT